MSSSGWLGHSAALGNVYVVYDASILNKVGILTYTSTNVSIIPFLLWYF